MKLAGKVFIACKAGHRVEGREPRDQMTGHIVLNLHGILNPIIGYGIRVLSGIRESNANRAHAYRGGITDDPILEGRMETGRFFFLLGTIG